MMPWLMMVLPLLAIAGVVIAPARQAKWIALLGTSAAFAVSILLALQFEHWGDGGFETWKSVEGVASVNSVPWLAKFGISLSVGADTVALMLILLTTLLMPLCVLGSFTAVADRVKEYYGWLLAIEAAMLGVFLARDVIFFYVCFEFTLVPMYFLIAIYGGENRAKACTKFFLYTFTGSVITLAGVLYVAWRYFDQSGMWSFDIATLVSFATNPEFGLAATEQAWVLLALLAGFAVKVPLFPVHTWLPLAHTEAPTAGSVILAGVLLKLGTYGLFRFVLPLVPEAVVAYAPAIAILSIIGILYAALICWVQTDIKKLVAYSSVSHLGFCVLGLFALNPLGLQGSVLYMINHGLSTGALFFLIGMIYERYHTRDMDQLGGLAKTMPVWAFFMIFFVLASVGLPGLNGFVSEILCLVGAFTASPDAADYPGVLGPWYAAVAGLGMIFAAMYLLIMVGKVVFGAPKAPSGHASHAGDHAVLPTDLSLREIGVLVPLAVLCLVLGFYPRIVTEPLEGSIEQTIAVYPDLVQQHLAAAGAETPGEVHAAVTDHRVEANDG